MLRKLTVHGFKSFSHRTDLTFGKGITAIVGPNGCGKSNLADALRWVLGEQNPRVLRSARLEDVIFGGTLRRKSMGMAEVKLLFDGIKGGVETEISRRYTRDGGSYYRINGKASRWKDVVETLSGTGLSHLAYVVIGQGMIQDLVTAKPDERRGWIEEASGVSKVRLGEKELERRLFEAGTDLTRLEDLLIELSSQKNKLSTDRDIAKKYRALKAEESDIKVSLSLGRYDSEKYAKSLAQRRLSRYEKELLDIQSKMPEIQSALKVKSEKAAVILTAAKQLEEEVAAQKDSLYRSEKEIETVKREAGYIERELSIRVARKQSVETEIEKNAALEKELLKELQAKKTALKDVACLHAEMENLRAASFEECRRMDKKAQSLRDQTISLTQKAGSIRLDRARVERDLKEISQKKSVTLNWLARKRVEEREISSAIKKARESLSSEKERLKKAQADFFALSAKEKEGREALETVLLQEKAASETLTVVLAKKRSLQELEDSFEGYALGPRNVLSANAKGLLCGVKGSVRDLLQVESAYIPALAAALGGALENIITFDLESAKNAISYLRVKNAGRATFLPITSVKPKYLNTKTLSVLKSMEDVSPFLSVVRYEKEIENVISYLLGRIVLAKDIDTGISFMERTGWTTKTVTLKGEALEPGGALTGGKSPRQEVLFRRKQELLDLAAEEKRLSKNLDEILAFKATKSKQHAGAVDEKVRADKSREKSLSEVRAKEESLNALKIDLASLQEEIKSKALQKESFVAQEMFLAEELKRIGLEERSTFESLEKATKEQNKFEAELKQVADDEKEQSDLYMKMASQKSALQDEVAVLSRHREGLLGALVSLKNSLEEEKKEISKKEEELTQKWAEIDRLTKEIGQLRLNLSELSTRLDAAFKEKQALSQDIASHSALVSQLVRDKDSYTEKKEDVQREIANLEKKIEEISSSITWEFGLKEPFPSNIERFKIDDVSERLERIDAALESLGNVNLKAEEEWEAYRERFDTLSAEKEDIIAAIAEIEKAKASIQKQMEERFRKTFLDVKDKFEFVFEELFGGGKGTLELDPETLDIEIIAEVPGSRQKRLDLLSGGERSLCGLALIFAILGVRPSPLIVLDEVDTALDDSNVLRFGNYLKKYSKRTQFLVITHQKATMEAADILYGVTMEEPGVSSVYGMRLQEDEALAEGVWS